MTKRAFALLALFLCSFVVNSFADTFRVATYNLENHLDQPTESRPHAKSSETAPLSALFPGIF